jgi:polysaccharide export outer membrane protein
MAVALCGLDACTTSGSSLIENSTSPTASAPTSSKPTPIRVAKLPAAVTADPIGAGQADYRIGPLDTLDVSVFGVPDLTKTVQVSGSGQIAFPLIGSVPAAGKTTQQLKTELEARLGAKYLQSPQVDVSVKEATSQRVTVQGAVKESGIFPLVGDTTLLQAIALAKGLDQTADPHGVLIFRKINGKKNVASFDLRSIQKGTTEDPTLQGGDVIVVDQSGLKAAWANLRNSLPLAAAFVPLL